MTHRPIKALLLEPFYGGSHRQFADGLKNHSRHTIDLITMPARFWKWRMRGAALYLYRHIDNLSDYDVLIVSDLMSLADFKALNGVQCPPALVYFHENQLTYPLAPGESRDFQFGFTDITTALTADAIRFNSHTHQNAFFKALTAFMPRMPEYRPRWAIDVIRSKTGVIYPGVELIGVEGTSLQKKATDEPPLIIWNHRWEFDKNPRAFFDALDTVLDQGIEFRLALLGENFKAVPKEFLAARAKYGRRIVHYGYEPSVVAYREWLQQGSIIISTARQENFGLAVIEAVSAGCWPLLPHRLAYPEVIPEKFHDLCLYRNQTELVTKLIEALTIADRRIMLRRSISAAMMRYGWDNQIEAYDQLLHSLAIRKALYS